MINDHLSKNPDILPNSKNPPGQNPVKEDMSGKTRTYGNPIQEWGDQALDADINLI